MRLLFVLFLLVHNEACDSHRLQYFVTTAPVPIPGLPKYSIVGYIDDMPYGKYTSETRHAEAFYKWLDEKTEPEHWKEMTQRAQNFERFHRDITRLIRVLFNQTTVPPKVEISGHQSDNMTKLHCLVYGFYPRAVDVKWVKNSKDDVYSDEAKQILPNPDATYQIRVTVEVIPKDGDTYSCHIDHSSLNNTMIMLWEPKRTSILVIVIVITVLAAVLSGIGMYIYRTVSGQHQRVNTQAT